MKSNKAILGVILVFLLGILCGGLATHLLYKYRFESILSGRTQNREEHIIKKLHRELDLDAGQEAQIRTIIHGTHEELNALRNSLSPQTEAIIESSQARISMILTPAQRKIYERIIAERKERKRGKGP